MTNEDQPKVPDSASNLQVSPQQSAAEQIIAPHLVRRNQICYAIIISMVYLAAPVLYVDVVQAAMCDKLGASKAIANLSSSLYLLVSGLAILFAWLIPYMRMVRRVIVVSYSVAAAMGAVTALVLISPASATAKIAMLVTHSIILGAALGVAGLFMWEVLSKGMSEISRGKLFSITYGFGPGFAVLGSVGTQAILGEKISWLRYPYDCAFLYGLTVPVLALMAFLGSRYYIAIPAKPERREAFVPFVFGGAWDFIRQRKFCMLVIAYLLFSAAWYVFINASLNLKEAMGIEPKLLAGTVQTLRFGGKMVAGFLLGWIVARRGARAGVVVGTLVTVGAVLWTLGARGQTYLVAFALFGAGELSALYYINYCVSTSKPENVKRNVSLYGLLTALPLAAMPTLHGGIADHWDFQVGFWVALAAGVAALLLVSILPYRPPAKTPVLSEEQLAQPEDSNESENLSNQT